MKPVFITGVGTDVGKTLVSAIVVKALNASYWKPVQAGGLDNTDSDIVSALAGPAIKIYPEAYRFKMPASPHTAAAAEKLEVDLDYLRVQYETLTHDGPLVIEGAGGLLVPLNSKQFVADLVPLFNAQIILVSRGYLGSINHSLLTAEVCKSRGLDVAGWIFTDENRGYEKEISSWSGFPLIATIPYIQNREPVSIAEMAELIREPLLNALH